MLPAELCNLIIDHLHDSKPSLLACSLVCRAWIPECRFHLFHNLRLCRDTADSFFQLFKSPHATLASAHIRELDVTQNTVIRGGSLEGDLLEGLAFQGVLTRCPADVFEHVQKLSVTRVGWWTLNGSERPSIGHTFKNVTELALWTVVFQKDEELQALVASFTSTGSLVLAGYTVPDQRFGGPSLTHATGQLAYHLIQRRVQPSCYTLLDSLYIPSSIQVSLCELCRLQAGISRRVWTATVICWRAFRGFRVHYPGRSVPQ